MPFFLVKVTVLKWNDPPKFVKVRGEENAIKEDFLLVDKTGSISMHVWGDNIKEIEDEKTSIISNLLLWQFLGKNYITASKSAANVEFDSMDIEKEILDCVLENLSPVLVEEFSRIEMVKDVCKYVGCHICKKKIDWIAGKNLWNAKNVKLQDEKLTFVKKALLMMVCD